jgi:pyruvate/2-oxoglutarate dehydrogenase complex dihydrolipoamide acyltransferase (E2) component
VKAGGAKALRRLRAAAACCARPRAPAAARACGGADRPPVVQTETRHGMEGFARLRRRPAHAREPGRATHGRGARASTSAPWQGTGPGGRIIKRDVELAIENKSARANRDACRRAGARRRRRAASRRPAAPLALSLPGRDVALVGHAPDDRAPRSSSRRRTIPHYQVTMKFDMDRLIDAPRRPTTRS